MENATQPDPTPNLPKHSHYQLTHVLDAILPPPAVDTPEAWAARMDDAIDAVASMRPVNANEAGFAGQCVIGRAQANDVVRQLRQCGNDIALSIRLNAQFNAMVRGSQGAHGHLLRA